MIKACFFILLYLTVSPLYAEIFKWTDGRGNIHFSDQPHPGAEIVKPSGLQIYSSSAVLTEIKTLEPKLSKKPFFYKSVLISQPKNEATIRNNQGQMSVVVHIQPALQPGDRLIILYDDKTVGKPQLSNIFILDNVERGAHTLVVQILDKQNRVLKSSNLSTVFMHRPRIAR